MRQGFRGGGPDGEIDAHKVADGLWQGSVPPAGDALAKAGFTLVVLCAEEYQLPVSDFPGVAVHLAPNDDTDELTETQLSTARKAARKVVAELARGGKVLVTCAAGMNRSGLVNGLALVLRHGPGADPRAIVAQIQARRPWALCNDHFVALIHAEARTLKRRATCRRTVDARERS